ncbi:MAG TPA: transglutaminase domain-containing protein [Vicinamibacterales bacterium]|nr:transglutaminase domain-containing protein [Vicinamibacterales bacterium]
MIDPPRYDNPTPGPGLNRSAARWRLLRPLPRAVTRPLSAIVLVAWGVTMSALVNRSCGEPAAANLATDLARYGSAAQWRGVYYRGEKIGFTVSQAVVEGDGFELQEEGRLQMSLLGATTAAIIRTRARVDRAFALREFDFSLDPGTGPLEVRGVVDGSRLRLSISTSGQTRTQDVTVAERPVLMQSVPRRLAAEGLRPGVTRRWTVFDPATLRNAPVVVSVGRREVVRAGSAAVPAFRVDMEFGGLRTTSWFTDTGEVVREESPMGLMTVRETPRQAMRLAVPYDVQVDLLQASAVVPRMQGRIDDPRDVRRLRLRVDGADLSHPDLQGAGQSVAGSIVELQDPRLLRASPADASASRYVAPEPFIESDDPEIRREAERAVADAPDARARAERLVRHVNGLLEKKPTVSLPSAREVLRTKIGDCNEHTALYVAMARAAGIPARVAVGLTFVRGAFYYHAWPEVYLAETARRGLWLPVDPTLNQFPADGTHLRLARGGLDRQSAILPLIGRLQIAVLDVELAPGTAAPGVPLLAGELPPLATVGEERGSCWSFLFGRRGR